MNEKKHGRPIETTTRLKEVIEEEDKNDDDE